jgi:response regulator RpfG family c-di-GMP phosphodiesterase
MPELSGHLTLKLLKHIKITSDIPVLMVSALSDVENLGLAVKSGTAGFISKPFTRATVYDKLVSIFGKEELELIAKGEPLVTDNRYFRDEYEKPKERQAADDSTNDEKEGNDAVKPVKPHITQDQLLQHYQEDEKRSIESIKKLLLKTRK